MFIALFDENKDVYERMNAFKLQASILLERYGNGAAQHYQYENAISTYLWLRYPDKYYIYKFGEVKNVANELETDYRFKRVLTQTISATFCGSITKSALPSKRTQSSSICFSHS